MPVQQLMAVAVEIFTKYVAIIVFGENVRGVAMEHVKHLQEKLAVIAPQIANVAITPHKHVVVVRGLLAQNLRNVFVTIIQLVKLQEARIVKIAVIVLVAIITPSNAQDTPVEEKGSLARQLCNAPQQIFVITTENANRIIWKPAPIVQIANVAVFQQSSV